MSRTTRPTPTSNHLTTSFLLLAQYGGRAVIPVAEVCRDLFAPLTLDHFLRKVAKGDSALPVIRMEASQKGAPRVSTLRIWPTTSTLGARLQGSRWMLYAVGPR